MNCPNCGAPYYENLQICDSCGARLIRSQRIQENLSDVAIAEVFKSVME